MKILGNDSHRQVFSPLSHKHIQLEGDKKTDKTMLKVLCGLKPTLQGLVLMPKLLLWICHNSLNFSRQQKKVKFKSKDHH